MLRHIDAKLFKDAFFNTAGDLIFVRVQRRERLGINSSALLQVAVNIDSTDGHREVIHV